LENTYRFGELVENDYGTFKIILTDAFDAEKDFDASYYFIFSDYLSLTESFRGFEIEPINREASILEIKLKNNNTQKAVNFLNMLTAVYLQRSLDQKNQIASNTINFIDRQLDVISDTLTVAETDLQNFQSDNEVMDLSFQAQQVYEYIQDLQKQKAELEVKSRYYHNLKIILRRILRKSTSLLLLLRWGSKTPYLMLLCHSLFRCIVKNLKFYYTQPKKPLCY